MINKIFGNFCSTSPYTKDQKRAFDCLKMQSTDKDVFVSFGSNVATSTKPINLLCGSFPYEIKILFTDIDGTLRSFDGSINQNTRDVSDSFKRKNIPVIISTGRTYTETKDVVEDLGLKSGYVITQQGAEIIDTQGNIIYQNKLDMDLAKKIVGAFEEYKATSSSEAKMVIYIDGIPYSKEKFLLPINWEEIKYGEEPLDLLNKGKSPTKILFYEPEKDINHTIDFMKSRLPADLRVGQTAKQYCEITNQNATKGNALNEILRLMGIDCRNAAAIGDADNDVPMLEFVKEGKGLSIVMGNAKDSVKKIGDYETARVDNDGYFLALDSILQNNSRLSACSKESQ